MEGGLSSRRWRLRAAILAAVVCLSACSPGYVLRAGWEEARILANRRPIHDVVHDTTVAPHIRAKLRLVQDGRDFSERTLGLDPGKSFRSYVELPRDTLVLNVSAAYELQLRWLTWWFPIVGHVPYRGFFDFDEALAEADRLAEQGYDVIVRPVSAFSTLGWLPDPVLSTTLRLDSVSLVETVVHETVHTTFFPAGQAHFNESFANFIGHRGAIAFFCDAVRDPGACQRARRAWHDTRVFGRFFRSVADPLQAVYAMEIPPEEKRRRKREIFVEAARRFETEVKPELQAGRYGSLDPESLNNAWVLGRLLYYTRLDDFERLYQRHENLRATFRRVVDAVDGGDPWETLDRLLARAGAGGDETRSSRAGTSDDTAREPTAGEARARAPGRVRDPAPGGARDPNPGGAADVRDPGS